MVWIGQDKTKSSDVIANAIEQTLFNRYPCLIEIILDRGREFLAEFSDMVQKDYGIKKNLSLPETHKPMVL